MSCRSSDAVYRLPRCRRWLAVFAIGATVCGWLFAVSHPAWAQQLTTQQPAEAGATEGGSTRPTSAPQAAQPANIAPAEQTPAAAKPRKSQAELEADLAKMLSGATLEGSFTMTGAGRDGARLSRDTYTLGDVKKLAGNIWLIQARIQYGDNDYTVPLPLPIQWAGDTPVIVVDEFTIPGQGTFSARVMFFADHYAGYWKHGERGGNMFGVIHRAAAAAATPAAGAAAGANTQQPPVETEK